MQTGFLIRLLTDDSPEDERFAALKSDCITIRNSMIPVEDHGRSATNVGVFERATRADALLATFCTADVTGSVCLRDDAAAVLEVIAIRSATIEVSWRSWAGRISTELGETNETLQGVWSNGCCFKDSWRL